MRSWRGQAGRDGSPGAPGAPGTPGHDGAVAPMDPSSRLVLERLLESLGENIDVLHGLEEIGQALERRYLRFARRLLKGSAVLAAFAVVALALTSVQLHRVRSTAGTARAFAKENRALIARLTVLADVAQRQGIRVNLSQCREIEKLKVPIRKVLRESGNDNGRFLVLFRARPCRALTPVKP